MENITNKKHKYCMALYWILVFEIISYGIGIITKDNIEWYRMLNKPGITPPEIVFPIIWTILYAILGLAGYFLYNEMYRKEIKPILILFLFQMIINWSWTPIFFGTHYYSVALGTINISNRMYFNTNNKPLQKSILFDITVFLLVNICLLFKFDDMHFKLKYIQIFVP